MDIPGGVQEYPSRSLKKMLEFVLYFYLKLRKQLTSLIMLGFSVYISTYVTNSISSNDGVVIKGCLETTDL